MRKIRPDKDRKPKRSASISRENERREPQTESKDHGRRRTGVLLGWLVGVAAVATLAGTLIGQNTDADPSIPASQIVALQQESAEEGFKLVEVDTSDPQQLETARQALKLTDADFEALLQRETDGEIELSWLTIWDNVAEDGDVVRISGGGYTIEVPILHQAATVVVPHTAGGSVELTGVRDGGGGITAGASSAGQVVKFPPLLEGQTIQIPVR